MSQKLFTMTEVAQLVRLSTATVKNRARLLKEPPLTVGRQRERLFTQEQVDEIKGMKK